MSSDFTNDSRSETGSRPGPEQEAGKPRSDSASDPARALRDNPEVGRYEAELADGNVAVLDYRIENDSILFTHTGTPEEHRGRGIASRLTRYALDDAVERGLKIAPHCPFVAWFVEQNPEYEAHLAAEFRSR